MADGYETEAQRVKKRLRETLTPREKLQNFWDYHKKHLLFGALALAVALYLATQALGEPKPDYTVAWVSPVELDSETEKAVTDALAAFGRDLNGDGEVSVALHRITLDLGLIIDRGGTIQGEQEQANLMSLEADLNIFQSGLFVTEDLRALQMWTGALCKPDGTAPDHDGEDWDRLVLHWADLPWPGEPPEGMDLYIACRGCWNEEQKDKWDETMAFLRAIETGGKGP